MKENCLKSQYIFYATEQDANYVNIVQLAIVKGISFP